MRLSASLDFAAAGEDSAAQDWTAAESAAVPARRMDEAAFQVFYAKTAPGLRGYLRRASGNEALADDILQECYLRFLRADLLQFRDVQFRDIQFRDAEFKGVHNGVTRADAPLKAYLYKIASSLLVDHWRRVKRERRWSLWNFLGGEPATNPKSESDAMRFFRRLKPQEQLLLWLAYVEGFEHREIAAALRLKEKSVRVVLFRARKKLARTLEEAGLGRKEAG
jgi:RNA polymerase sigma-70 factor (ECF subfamily)